MGAKKVVWAQLAPNEKPICRRKIKWNPFNCIPCVSSNPRENATWNIQQAQKRKYEIVNVKERTLYISPPTTAYKLRFISILLHRNELGTNSVVQYSEITATTKRHTLQTNVTIWLHMEWSGIRQHSIFIVTLKCNKLSPVSRYEQPLDTFTRRDTQSVRAFTWTVTTMMTEHTFHCRNFWRRIGNILTLLLTVACDPKSTQTYSINKIVLYSCSREKCSRIFFFIVHQNQFQKKRKKWTKIDSWDGFRVRWKSLVRPIAPPKTLVSSYKGLRTQHTQFIFFSFSLSI